MLSSPITSWQIDGETIESVTDFIFLGSKITADGDYSHEIKRHLLLGRKAMTNLDSILKNRDITLPTKVHQVGDAIQLSSSVVPFSSCLQSFPASRSFPVSQFFASSGQSIGVSASASVLPMNIQDWFPLGWTGLISLPSQGLSRVFSNTTLQNHQFFSPQLSL